jgi:hypothetical protein
MLGTWLSLCGVFVFRGPSMIVNYSSTSSSACFRGRGFIPIQLFFMEAFDAAQLCWITGKPQKQSQQAPGGA